LQAKDMLWTTSTTPSPRCGRRATFRQWSLAPFRQFGMRRQRSAN